MSARLASNFKKIKKFLNFLNFSGSTKRELFKKRTRTVFLFFILVALLIIVRLYFLQIIQNEYYVNRAERQYVKHFDKFYDRGEIFFTNKNGKEISGATIKTGYSLAINPSLIKDPEELYKRLSDILPVNKSVFLRASSKKNDPYEILLKRVDDKYIDKIKNLDDRAVILSPVRFRYYPGESLAAHILGFVAYNGDKRVGRYGLEKYFEDVLKREESSIYVNFFAELFSNVRDIVLLPPNKREGDIITTIEPSVQVALERTLNEVKSNWESQMVAGIIIDPNTGSVYAMAVNPSFDVNKFNEANPKLYPNILVERVYEMGSIIKPITLAAGIDLGVINANTSYYDRGNVRVENHTIYNYDKRARGENTTMQDVLSQSLNTGMVFAQRRIGNQKLREYMYKFGFNEETGIDLPYESMNLIDNLTSNRNIEYATASFGQGIALTPISTARALSVLATGYLPQPHLVKKIRSTNGMVNKIDYSDMKVKVLEEKTVEEISRMLTVAVDTKLLGGSMKLERYSVAAKTGTAQIPKKDGGYYEDDVLHTFFGYFPSYEPRFLVLLMSFKPKGAPYAAQTLSKPFFDIAKFLINYYDIPPDR